MKIMNLLVASLFLQSTSGLVFASPCTTENIEEIVKQLSFAWVDKKMEKLDKISPYDKSIQIVIEHSITAEYEVEESKSLKKLDQWLNNLEDEGIPVRESRPLMWCKKGLCVFNLFDKGISHNHIYMQKITYSSFYGCHKIRTIFLYNGD